MAHDEACIGTWENSTLGGQPDGKIKINPHTGTKITGWHFNTNKLIEGTCTGSEQNFSRPIANGKKVKYKNGKILRVGARYEITGTFEDESKKGPNGLRTAAKKSKTKARRSKASAPPDEWEADKTT